MRQWELTGRAEAPVEHKLVLLSDNGSGYISGLLNENLDLMQIRHIFCAALHPQMIGKCERLNRTAKAKLELVIYASPEELEHPADHVQPCHNHKRYHEAPGARWTSTIASGSKFTAGERRC